MFETRRNGGFSVFRSSQFDGVTVGFCFVVYNFKTLCNGGFLVSCSSHFLGVTVYFVAHKTNGVTTGFQYYVVHIFRNILSPNVVEIYTCVENRTKSLYLGG